MKMNNKKQLKLLEKIAVKVEALADTYAAMTDARLKECTSLFKARLESGESLDSVLPEAFAVVREAAKRVLNMYHFHVQVLGGIALPKRAYGTRRSHSDGKRIPCPTRLRVDGKNI